MENALSNDAEDVLFLKAWNREFVLQFGCDLEQSHLSCLCLFRAENYVYSCSLVWRLYSEKQNALNFQKKFLLNCDRSANDFILFKIVVQVEIQSSFTHFWQLFPGEGSVAILQLCTYFSSVTTPEPKGKIDWFWMAWKSKAVDLMYFPGIFNPYSWKSWSSFPFGDSGLNFLDSKVII